MGKFNFNKIYKFYRALDIQNSLTFKILKIVFSIYIFITVSITGSHMLATYQNTKVSIYSEMKRFGPILNQAMSDSLWNVHYNTVDNLMSNLIKNSSIIGVYIKSSAPNNIDFIYGETPSVQSNNFLEYSFTITHANNHNQDIELAKVTLYSNTSKILNHVKIDFLLLILNAFIKTISLWILFLYAGYIYLNAPFKMMIKIINKAKINTKGSYKLITLNEKRFSGTELFFFANTFNTMFNKLTETRNFIKQTRTRVQHILDFMPSLILVIDELGLVCHWNKAIRLNSGIATLAAIGQPFDKLLPKLNTLSTSIGQVQRSQKTLNFSQVNNLFGKRSQFFDITICPFRHQSDNLTIIRFDEVTHQIRMKEVLLESEKLSSLGSLAAGVAHEINNPLGAILQSSQNFLRRIDDTIPSNISAAQECDINLRQLNIYLEKRGIFSFIKGIQEAGERAAKIVANLLQFSRKIVAPKAMVDIIPIIEKSLDLLTTDFNLKNGTDFKKIQIKKVFDLNFPKIFLSSTEIEHAILNILKNAAQSFSSENASPEIIVKAWCDTQFFYLSIKDNGCGMSSNIKKRIFNPFYTTKKVTDSKGLGLTIAKTIIEDNHKGSITVETMLNIGSEFIITLPISEKL